MIDFALTKGEGGQTCVFMTKNRLRVKYEYVHHRSLILIVNRIVECQL